MLDFLPLRTPSSRYGANGSSMRGEPEARDGQSKQIYTLSRTTSAPQGAHFSLIEQIDMETVSFAAFSPL